MLWICLKVDEARAGSGGCRMKGVMEVEWDSMRVPDEGCDCGCGY